MVAQLEQVHNPTATHTPIATGSTDTKQSEGENDESTEQQQQQQQQQQQSAMELVLKLKQTLQLLGQRRAELGQQVVCVFVCVDCSLFVDLRCVELSLAGVLYFVAVCPLMAVRWSLTGRWLMC